MWLPRALLLAPSLLLVLGAPRPAAAEGLRLVPTLGLAAFERGRGATEDRATGLALELRLEGDTSDPHLGYAVNLTWGLTDWDRAREYVRAGNRAGSWTTDRFADMEAWVRRGREDKTEGARILGAIFADLFLALSYAAVPACYVGSAFGATSHVQLDATASAHLASGARNDAWLELGGGAAALPTTGLDWRRAAGPVVGVGARFGPVRVGARMLWSPPGANTAVEGGTVRVTALTLAWAR